MKKTNYRQIKAIEQTNKKRLLKVNPELNDWSGIYFLTRTDEDGISYFYIGQAKHILSRMASHLVGYQHIDISLKKRGFYSEDNPYGWKLNFLNYPIETLDEYEQYWILEYTKRGYQCRYNKTAGGQGQGKVKINDYKPSKTYRDGLKQGRNALAKELSHIIEKHLEIGFKEGKEHNKVSQKAREKFFELLNEENYKEV
jgi:flagellar hook-associated protein FlgK